MERVHGRSETADGVWTPEVLPLQLHFTKENPRAYTSMLGKVEVGEVQARVDSL